MRLQLHADFHKFTLVSIIADLMKTTSIQIALALSSMQVNRSARSWNHPPGCRRTPQRRGLFVVWTRTRSHTAYVFLFCCENIGSRLQVSKQRWRQPSASHPTTSRRVMHHFTSESENMRLRLMHSSSPSSSLQPALTPASSHRNRSRGSILVYMFRPYLFVIVPLP